ncbi:effector-associated constant component EACC1 [Streptomyces subrutilus]|uniref:Uncharacterized protein n=1 Tax=Streptomyces subrutilus TaxID=36818 RepID=A0A5P2USX8_9ACTN|nr:hypothetical protein [Streptomyces subrutilus]QEU81449.1 hypothetical protein CP968_27030 [Streptomyces subrutilus]WSJ29213.1 hypothetical protein OG479_07720 [Streptomyces subrutilus]GGZ94677.1 hypothetical protein GCM10010371_63240 [Streptomyces subrutilus]
MTHELALRVDERGPGAGAEDELRSLLRWLTADETLAGGLRTRLVHDPDGAPDTDVAAEPMGFGLDLLQLAVGSGLSTGSLVFAVLQWQASRRPAPDLTVRRGDYEVRLTGDAARDPDALARVLAALEPADATGAGDDDGTA